MEQKETRAQVWNGPMATHAVATSREPIQFQTSWTLRSCLSLGEIAVSIWTGVGKLESISTCQWITKNSAVPWSKLPQLVVSQLSTGLFYFCGASFLSTHDHFITCQWFECFCDEHSAFWLRLTSYFVFRIAKTSLQWQQLKQCARDARVRDIVLLIVITYPSSAVVSTARLRVTLPRSVRSCDTVLTANAKATPIATAPSYWRKEPRHERQMTQRVGRPRPAMVSLVWAQLQHGHHHLPRSIGSNGLNHRNVGCKPWLKMKKNRHARSRRSCARLQLWKLGLLKGKLWRTCSRRRLTRSQSLRTVRSCASCALAIPDVSYQPKAWLRPGAPETRCFQAACRDMLVAIWYPVVRRLHELLFSSPSNYTLLDWLVFFRFLQFFKDFYRLIIPYKSPVPTTRCAQEPSKKAEASEIVAAAPKSARHSKKVLASACLSPTESMSMFHHVSLSNREKNQAVHSSPFRWWSRRSCFVNCSWSTESTESTVSFSWATCSKRSPSTGISRRLSCLCWSCLFAANNLPCFNSCGHFQITIQWSVSVLQRTLQSWTIEDACDFLAMLPGQPLASGVDASRTMTFRRDKENKELLWTGFTNTSYLMYQQLLSFSFIFYDSLSFTVLFSVGDSRLTLGREAGAVRVGRASASWPTSSEKGVGDGEWKNIQKKKPGMDNMD